MDPLVAIVIVNYNNAPDTQACLTSCLGLQYPRFHIWLVDNGSTDQSLAAFRAAYANHPQISLLAASHNLGFAGGCNLGLEQALQAGSDLIWLLNNDTTVNPQTLSHLVAASQRSPTAGIFGSKIYWADPPDTLWFAGGQIRKAAHHSLGLGEVDRGQYDHVVEVDYVSGCSLLIRTATVQQIGLMATHYFLYWEEVDWCSRAQQAGWSCQMVPQSTLSHRGGGTTGRNPVEQYRYHIRNWLLYTWRFQRRQLPTVLTSLWRDWRHQRRIRPDLAQTVVWATVDFVAGRTGPVAPWPGRWGYNVFGHPQGSIGLAAATRHTLHLLHQAGQPLEIREIEVDHQRIQPLQPDNHPLSHNVWQLRYPINLLHMNPPEVLQSLPLRWPFLPLEQRMNVIVPFWELPVLPPDWVETLDELDAILAPSRFTQEVYARYLPHKPILYYPQAFALPGPATARRGHFGLPPDRYLFLMAFDMTSDIERKNPWGAIDAFQQAFGAHQPVSLIIKVNNPRYVGQLLPLYQKLKERVAADPRLQLLEQTYSYQEVLDLWASCDALVSLHRAEGLGLVLMECMALGKPVIATAWSGNMDFCTPQNTALVGFDLVPVQASLEVYQQLSQQTPVEWAEPRLAEAAQWMRRLYENPELGARLGQQAAHDMKAWAQQDRLQVFDQLKALFLSAQWHSTTPLKQRKLYRRRIRSISRYLVWRWPRLAPLMGGVGRLFRSLGLRR